MQKLKYTVMLFLLSSTLPCFGVLSTDSGRVTALLLALGAIPGNQIERQETSAIRVADEKKSIAQQVCNIPKHQKFPKQRRNMARAQQRGKR